MEEQESEALAPSEAPQGAETQQAPARVPKKKTRSGGSQAEEWDWKRLNNAFVACPRCGYFLTSYRVLFGIPHIEASLAESGAGRMPLTWNIQVRDLVYRSYGYRIDQAFDQFQLACSECRRVLIYEPAESDETSAVFEIDLMPRSIMRR